MLSGGITLGTCVYTKARGEFTREVGLPPQKELKFVLSFKKDIIRYSIENLLVCIHNFNHWSFVLFLENNVKFG